MKKHFPMKSTAKKITRTIVARRLCTVAFMAIATSPSVKADRYNVYAFGQQLSIPQNTASGQVLARHYITPMQVCGSLRCYVIGVTNYSAGGAPHSGPIIKTNVSGISTRLLINGSVFSSATSFTQPIEVQLLSNEYPNLGGSLAGAASGTVPYYKIFTKYGDTYIYMTGTITPIAGTCSVPSQTVKLPSTMLNKLDQVGSTAGTKNFQIQVNNCPKGYNRIGYLLEPVGGVIENAPGVLPLTGGSTASGVKIQITDDKGQPATMGTSIQVDGYKKETGGSHAIPMQASYLRTGVTATPGTVNGALNVLLDYQ
ncbi:fimbrial protein [Pseudomonas chlororaphis]|uniref:fimbrial protein n=1 Tax=Pseudomonas chlororaphis TaxID=587753 RepID=UPI001EE6770A|nr:fimbrial protein [Pseudomonas chlororaphis]